MLISKLFAISSFLVSAALAVPLSPVDNAIEVKRENVDAREYWGGVIKREEDLDAREYWGGVIKREEDLDAREYWGGVIKRGKLDPNCVQTAKGIFCTYTDDEMTAYNVENGSKDEVLEPYCFKTPEGTACAYHINQK